MDENTFFRKIKLGNSELDISKWSVVTSIAQKDDKVLIIFKVDEKSFNFLKNKDYPMTIKFGAFGRIKVMLDEKKEQSLEPAQKQLKI